MTTEQVNELIRSNKIHHDIRLEDSRYTILELKPFVSYCLIISKLGEYESVTYAQNAPTLLLKKFN